MIILVYPPPYSPKFFCINPELNKKPPIFEMQNCFLGSTAYSTIWNLI